MSASDAASIAGLSVAMHPSQLDHLQRVARSRAKLEAFNAKMEKNRARGIENSLQRAAARFLAPGTQLETPRVRDLARWPYAGLQRIDSDVPETIRDSVLTSDALCVWCRKEPSTTIDHVHPLSRGGSNDPLNLVGACEPCNSVKADFMPSEMGWVMRLPLRAFTMTPPRAANQHKTPEK